MVESMKSVASMDLEMTVEERNLLSVAYKNVIGARRASWRIISFIEQELKTNEDKLGVVKSYREQVEKELKEIYLLQFFLHMQRYSGSVGSASHTILVLR